MQLLRQRRAVVSKGLRTKDKMIKLFKQLFSSNKNQESNTYEDFWKWFSSKEKIFFQIVKDEQDIENNFFNYLTPKLENISEDLFFMTGMLNEEVAELILTADGNVRKFYIIEELVQSAPKLENWKFTAHKPELDIKNVGIRMGDLEFNSENQFFTTNNLENYPDEIDLTIIHSDYTDENSKNITIGCYIFLDNYLGEMNFASTIDNISINSKSEGSNELIPIYKLKDYLNWRQKEFIEKYEDIIYKNEKDEHSIFEFKLSDKKVIIAVINTDLLKWENKVSHPWILSIKIGYDSPEEKNGMPTKESMEQLEIIEDEITSFLTPNNGQIYLGRQTGNHERSIFWVCKDFRKPSKILDDIIKKYKNSFSIEFDVYKDKYWKSFNSFVKY